MSSDQNVLHRYGSEFNTASAEVIIPYLIKTFKCKSVIDIGCGIGTWLKVFLEKGITDVLGTDGEHVLGTNQLLIPKYFFYPSDLNKLSFSHLNRKFDIALCLEVVEHLDEKYAANFINQLCQFSKIIIFSAAVPGQTGENHLNEQYADYWQKKFALNDFTFFDPFRSLFWNNEKVEWWYRQNIFVAIHQSIESQFDFKRWDGSIYIIKNLLELYVHHFKTFNSNGFPDIQNKNSQENLNQFSLKTLMRHIFIRIEKKIKF